MTDLKQRLLNSQMVMFGGKGGVGKTSCAASSAIWAAEHGRNTLIISTDPAHSLGDSFGVEFPPGKPTPVKGIDNLTALEINPKANMSEFQSLTNMNPVEEMGIPGMGDMGMFSELQEFSSMNPPGIDEALAFAKVLEFIETDHPYDLVIFDTAPTGHTLRFLSLPETLSGWIGKLMKLRLKIGNIFGTIKNFFKREDGEEGEDDEDQLELLEKLNQSIINARDDLKNPDKNTFVIVMIPEEMAVAETGRLMNELIKYNIPSTNIVVNQLYPDSEELCDFCRSRKKMQHKHLKRIKQIFGQDMNKNIIEVPLFKEEIRKYSKLKEMSEYLIKE
ncbi:MAG: arsenic-transporting ATPase [Promethearchaeota archaeon]|nr:MAG: arsenic-transporting ATPase [Candidatus Lokiarchaeota archaeon]